MNISCSYLQVGFAFDNFGMLSKLLCCPVHKNPVPAFCSYMRGLTTPWFIAMRAFSADVR